MFLIREFDPADEPAIHEFGASVIGWWHNNGPSASCQYVAEEQHTGQIVGHLQATDRSLPLPSRRPGQCHFTLQVDPDTRRRGIGSALYERLEVFAASRSASLLYTSFLETPDAPAAPFLRQRGYAPLERFLPSVIDLREFDPAAFQSHLERVRAEGIELRTYSDLGDSAENRRRLYELEQRARSTQPYREVTSYIWAPYEAWEDEFKTLDWDTVFVAVASAHPRFVGMVKGLVWNFTGVHPGWRGRGVATALKILCLGEAQRRGMTLMETENHEDNAAMLAINRKLGFRFTTPEVAYVLRMLPGSDGQ